MVITPLFQQTTSKVCTEKIKKNEMTVKQKKKKSGD